VYITDTEDDGYGTDTFAHMNGDEGHSPPASATVGSVHFESSTAWSSANSLATYALRKDVAEATSS
jgi:hypothetical protein